MTFLLELCAFVLLLGLLGAIADEWGRRAAARDARRRNKR